jgi:aminopeptidase N
MIQHGIGGNTWAKGTRHYLTSNFQGVVSPDALYASLQQAVDEDMPNLNMNVKSILGSWENQAGYPVVTVLRISNNMNLRQDKFSYSNEASDDLWWIPVTYVVGSDPNFSVTKPDIWIPGERQRRVISGVTSRSWQENDWIIVNSQAHGFYRVNYDTNSWNRIINHLKSDNYQQINTITRAKLIDDSMSLAKVGRTPYATALELLGYLSRETEYVPWAAVSWKLTSHRTTIYDEFKLQAEGHLSILLLNWLPSNLYFQPFISKIVEALYNRFSFEVVANETAQTRLLRSLAIHLACLLDHPDCLAKTDQKLTELVTNGVEIAPDLQSAIFCGGLRNRGEANFAFLKERLLKSTNQAERSLIIDALSCSPSSLLDQLLVVALEDGLRSHEEVQVLLATIKNSKQGVHNTLVFIDERFTKFVTFPSAAIHEILSEVSNRIFSDEQVNQFTQVLNRLTAGGYISVESFNDYRASVNFVVKWHEDYGEVIVDWIRNGGTTTTTQRPSTDPTPEDTTPGRSTTEDTTLGASSAVASVVLVLGSLLMLLM